MLGDKGQLQKVVQLITYCLYPVDIWGREDAQLDCRRTASANAPQKDFSSTGDGDK